MNEKKIEEYVLSLIWCFLQDALNEINNENDIMKIFEKKVGYFFKYLYKQKKIKEYFYNILSFEFKTIEFNNNGKWLFEEMKNIDEYNAKKIEEEMKKNTNTMDEVEKNIFNQQFNANKVLFKTKLNEFFKEEIKDENNKYMDKIKLKLQNQIKNEGIESFNMDQIINIFLSDDSNEEFYLLYTFSVYTAYRCVENILLTLGENLDEIPNIIKYILKMIKISIQNKFPNIKKELIVNVLKTFFFEFLLIKLNEYPYFEFIYEENVISPETKYKTKIINEVILQYINGIFYSNKNNILYSPFNMLFFNEKLEKVFELFDDLFYENIHLPNKIEEFMKYKEYKWEILNNNHKEQNYFEELSFCTFSKIEEIIIDIISKLDINKIPDIQKGNLYEIMIDKKDSLQKDSYFIFQETNLPFQFKERKIKCFNKEVKIKENDKIEDNKINKEVTLEDKLIIFLFGISDLNEKDYSETNKLFTEFLIETLELINDGKIVCLGLEEVDTQIEWYGNSILSLINEIDEDFKKNNFKKLFDNIQSDLNQSINEINEKSNKLFNLYSKIELLKEKDIEELNKHIKTGTNDLIVTYLENENEKIFSCYTINDKIINYVKENKLVDECINLLINGKEKENNENMSLEIKNFPKILSDEDKNFQINKINNYLQIDKYFETDKRKKEIEENIINNKSVVKKVFDYVLSNALKKGLNEVDYYSRKDGDLKKKLKVYEFVKKDKKTKDNQITADNFFTTGLKDDVEKFIPEFQKCIKFFELEGEPTQKMKHLENAYDIVKNVYELSASSATFDIQTIILLWKYFIMFSDTRKLFSSLLILHLFIRKDLLTVTQVEILFAVKAVIKDIFNLNSNQFINLK